MKLKTTLSLAVAGAVLATAAHAYEGPYGALGAGLSLMQEDRDFESEVAATAFDSDIDYDKGIGVYTALGYAYDSNFRTELELAFRDNDVRHVPGGAIGGSMESLSLMANVLYDFDGVETLTPYLGVGVGGARLDADIGGTYGGTAVDIDDSSINFAYQAIAGVAFELAEGLALDLSYRYFATLKPEFDATIGATASAIKTGYANHSLFAGLRWNFGAPAAAAAEYKDCWDGSSVPVSADCPPQLVEDTAGALDPLELIVYFDYDKSNLTPEASSLIQEAAGRALSNDIDTVVVSGNTDTSGSSAYNQTLSERRARVVSDALVANGISADMIETRAFGESNLAKPTPDGTREPLNRRSEVVISFE